jgi:hypothetical protein
VVTIQVREMVAMTKVIAVEGAKGLKQEFIWKVV